uniref:Uncharacterized protein n=1 Tax=Setaria italica TaxID=4555 RepID=K3YMH2_SETIT
MWSSVIPDGISTGSSKWIVCNRYSVQVKPKLEC